MTALALRWRCPPPPILLRWRGMDDITAEAIAQARDPGPIATLIGPPGLGGDGSGSSIARSAGEALGGHRAIAVDGAGLAFYADPGDPLLRIPAGVSVGAVAIGDPVTIQIGGDLVEPSWSWSAGSIFVGPSGLLTQSPPSSGAIVIVGQATGPTSMRIDPQLVALLN